MGILFAALLRRGAHRLDVEAEVEAELEAEGGGTSRCYKSIAKAAVAGRGTFY